MDEGGKDEAQLQGIKISSEKVDELKLGSLPSPTRKTEGDPTPILDAAVKRKESGAYVPIEEADLFENLKPGDVLYLLDTEGNEVYYHHNGEEKGEGEIWGAVRIVFADGRDPYQEDNAVILGSETDAELNAGRVLKGKGIRIATAPKKELSWEDTDFFENPSHYIAGEFHHLTPIVEMRIIPTVPRSTSGHVQ